jgi:hypothetical protein
MASAGDVQVDGASIIPRLIKVLYLVQYPESTRQQTCVVDVEFSELDMKVRNAITAMSDEGKLTRAIDFKVRWHLVFFIYNSSLYKSSLYTSSLHASSLYTCYPAMLHSC